MAHITIPTSDAWVSYTATAAQTAFSIPFAYRDGDDIEVYVNGALQGSGYTVTGSAVDGGYTGGTVTFSAGRTLNDIVRLRRVTPSTRTTDFPYPSQTLNIETLNDQIDYIFMRLQEIERDRLRTLRVADSSPELNALPEPEDLAGMVIYFDDDGVLSYTLLSSLTGGGGGGGGGPVAIADVTGLTAALAGKAASVHTHASTDISDSTAAGRTLLTAADAAAQRTALGLGTAALDDAGDYAAATHAHNPTSPTAGLTQGGATTDQVLAWNGTNWAPTTLALGLKKISTTSITASAQMDVTLPTGYDYFLLVITGMRVGTTNVELRVRASQDGASYLSGASEYLVASWSASGSLLINTSPAGAQAQARVAQEIKSADDIYGTMEIMPGSAGRNAFIRAHLDFVEDTTAEMKTASASVRLATTTARLTNLRVYPSSGNFVAQGNLILYGAVT
jgi:hypothetical protein